MGMHNMWTTEIYSMLETDLHKSARWWVYYNQILFQFEKVNIIYIYPLSH